MPKLQTKDLIAIVALSATVLVYIYKGTGNIDSMITLVLGYYFAKRTNGTDTGI